jgi:hypothetical protein
MFFDMYFFFVQLPQGFLGSMSAAQGSLIRLQTPHRQSRKVHLPQVRDPTLHGISSLCTPSWADVPSDCRGRSSFTISAKAEAAPVDPHRLISREGKGQV